MSAADVARQAALKRAGMLERLQPVKQEARSRLGELRAQAETLTGEAKDAKNTRNLTASHAFDLFVTPRHLAERMVEIAGIRQGMGVLEPSAGTGRIADAIQAKGCAPECVELNSELVDHLRKRGHLVHHDNFMNWTPTPAFAKYDAVLLNPPFSNGQDADHVQRAYEFTMDGGIVVAIMGEGIFIRSDRKAQAFREWLENVGGDSEPLPAGTFRQSGTGVNTRLVTIRK